MLAPCHRCGSIRTIYNSAVAYAICMQCGATWDKEPPGYGCQLTKAELMDVAYYDEMLRNPHSLCTPRGMRLEGDNPYYGRPMLPQFENGRCETATEADKEFLRQCGISF